MISVRTSGGEETIVFEEFERRVQEGLISPSTLVRFSVLTGEEWIEAGRLELYHRLYAPARVRFMRDFTLGRFPVLTALLCLMQIGIYVSVGGLQSALPLDVLVAAGAKMHAHVFELGETWRLLTANVLHRDLLHLAFNMFFLFNVGGTIENTYRWQDFLLVVVVSAVSTTLLSAVMSDRPSVRASGVVLGMFGAASVFGYKYSEILPARYRRYFGGAVLPYALFILYVGLVSDNTDNWGHVGGFVGGFVVAAPMTPRLLNVSGRSGHARDWWSIIALVSVVGAVLVAGPVVRALGPSLRAVRHPQVGLQLVVPTRWRPTEADHLGYPGWGNMLGMRLGWTHDRSDDRPVRLADLRRRFLKDELGGPRSRGRNHGRAGRARAAGLDRRGRALVLDISLESRAGPQMTRNLLIERGYYSFRIVMSGPVAWFEGYDRMFDAVTASVRLIDTQSLVQGRRLAAIFPGMSSAHVELGDQLALIGEVKRADEMYRRALRALPDHPPAQYARARLAADYDLPLQSAARWALALHQRFPEQARYASLLADILQRLGQMDAACSVLQETLDRTSEPTDDLRDRVRTLRCRSGAWADQ